jgi:acyl dehydratase
VTTISGIDGIRALAGQEWGPGDWLEITQERVNQFADATDDHQWIHVDVARANAGPFKGTIAHGFLTLSLVLTLTRSETQIEGIRMAINYGLNRVRFPAPVRVGSRIRASTKNLSVEDVEGGLQVVNQITVEIEGEAKPACVAELVARFYA